MVPLTAGIASRKVGLHITKHRHKYQRRTTMNTTGDRTDQIRETFATMGLGSAADRALYADPFAPVQTVKLEIVTTCSSQPFAR